MRRALGFTLVELAVVLAIVGLLLGSLMYTLSAQNDQRNIEDTQRTLQQAKDMLLAFAVANGRLPCPARSTSNGAEVQIPDTDPTDSNRGQCMNASSVQDYYGGTLSDGTAGGFYPAATVGFPRVDGQGFAIDAWGNRLRYAVTWKVHNPSCATAPPAGTVLFTSYLHLQTYGLACLPDDLLVCKSGSGITSSSCGGTSNQIMTQDLVVAIVFSTGKNGAISGGTGIDEAANLNGGGTADPIFVFHAPTPPSSPNGEFDDQFTWITVGELYSKLVSAAKLP